MADKKKLGIFDLQGSGKPDDEDKPKKQGIFDLQGSSKPEQVSGDKKIGIFDLGYAEGGAVKPNYDKFATDPERWSKVGRMGFDPDAPNPSIKGEDYPKKGSYTVPKMCGGGKVIKTWSK